MNGCERCGVHVSNGEAWYAHSLTGDLIRVCGECWEKVKKPIPETTSLSQRTRIAKAKPAKRKRKSLIDIKGLLPTLVGANLFAYCYPRYSIGIILGIYLFGYGAISMLAGDDNGHHW